MKTFRLPLFFAITTLMTVSSVVATAQNTSERSAMLDRVYQMRMAIERDRARAEGEARSNVRLIGQAGDKANASSPTVTAMRAETYQHLSRFEQNFRCLDVDVTTTSGNTVVICGDNSGDIDGSNVNAQRDIIIPSDRK
ncbi:MAG: hypothetical protein NXH85_01955 [Pseudomonadaceae bacterium]|nr:hypothetical protein [Pseudomonadaceae bacterium]